MMAKVLITPIKSEYCDIKPFEIDGKLTSKLFQNDGLIYYIKGNSYPSRIVTILEGGVDDD